MKNTHPYLSMVSLKACLVALLTLSSFVVSAASLEKIKYSTLQNDEIDLVFTLSEVMSEQPLVKTSMQPAKIDVTFDVNSFSDHLANTTVDHAGVKYITVKKFGGKVTASIHLEELSVFDVSQKGNNFSLTLNKNIQGTPVENLTQVGRGFINNVDSIDFRKGPDAEGQLLVYLADSKVAVNVEKKSGKLHVEFHNTNISDDLIYKLDVTDFGTIVQGVETFQEGRNVRFVVDVKGRYSFKHNQLENVFSLVMTEDESELSFVENAEDFTGKAISLNFQDISVRTVLQIIADYNGFNLVTSDTVNGNVTLRLDGVPWDQALEIILKVKGLAKRMEGNILLIAPSSELSAQENQELQAQQQAIELAPLYSEYLQVNYAKAAEFASLIKNEGTNMLSARGSVSVDERTNTLLIRDTQQSIDDIKRMISVLDIPVRQVIIESRMVTITDDIKEDIGIRWGMTSTNNDFASAGTLTGAETAASGPVPSLSDRLNVNLPVASPAGSIAFQIARLSDGTILDLELSAMEQEGKGEVIASPRITTANQKEAYIEQGVEIAYQEASSSGATSTQFKKAVLSLTVTPHITPDNRIILDLVVTQDTVASAASGEAPAINTQRIGTQVLVDNGETIVLGGVYQQAVVTTISKVPLLGDIPFIGWLFRSTSNLNEKKELLIFVTPRVVTDKF